MNKDYILSCGYDVATVSGLAVIKIDRDANIEVMHADKIDTTKGVNGEVLYATNRSHRAFKAQARLIKAFSQFDKIDYIAYERPISKGKGQSFVYGVYGGVFGAAVYQTYNVDAFEYE
jgi:hypothetical protein